MNKRASIAFVMVCVVLLVLLIALLLFVNTVFTKTKESIPEQRCALSVQREAGVNLAGKAAGAASTAHDFSSNIECQTIPVDLTKNDDAAIAAIPYIDKCWKTFGSGAKDLFSRAGDKNAFCAICYALALKPGTSIDLKNALAQRQIPAEYDVPVALAGGTLAVVFSDTLSESGAVQKVLVRPMSELGACANAEFPPQRLT